LSTIKAALIMFVSTIGLFVFCILVIKTYGIEDNIYMFGLYGSLFVTFRINFTLIILYDIYQNI
jgi:hypothetical protein